MSRSGLRVLLVFADALIAVQCAGVAWDFWHIVAGRIPIGNLLFPDLLWHTTSPWVREWDRLEVAMIAGTFVSGGILAPLLIRFLSRRTGRSLPRFLMSSAVAGMVYAWMVVTLTSGIVGVVYIPASSIPPPLSFGLFLIGGAAAITPVFAPLVVLVGSVVGMLNGVLVRRAWGQDRLLL